MYILIFHSQCTNSSLESIKHFILFIFLFCMTLYTTRDPHLFIMIAACGEKVLNSLNIFTILFWTKIFSFLLTYKSKHARSRRVKLKSNCVTFLLCAVYPLYYGHLNILVLLYCCWSRIFEECIFIHTRLK